MMTFEEFRDACFRYASEQGCENAEVYATSSDGFSVNVLNKEIIKYSVERSKGLNLRVLYAGKTGYAYTEVYEDPETLVGHAIDNAKAIENTDANPMQGACAYPEISVKPNPPSTWRKRKRSIWRFPWSGTRSRMTRASIAWDTARSIRA